MKKINESYGFKRFLYFINKLTVFIPVVEMLALTLFSVLVVVGNLLPEDWVLRFLESHTSLVMNVFAIFGMFIRYLFPLIGIICGLQLVLMVGVFIFGFKRLREFGKYYLGAILGFLSVAAMYAYTVICGMILLGYFGFGPEF
jgi:hypothetical protein